MRPDSTPYSEQPTYTVSTKRNRTYTRLPVAERLWAKVNKNGPIPTHCPELGPCWLWKGATTKWGYGVVGTNGAGVIDRTHRVAWRVANGPIPDGLWVLHRCDVRHCVNPTHLYLGDRAQNTRDMLERGRQGHANYPGKNAGQTHGMSKLTNAQVIEMRRRGAQGESNRALAAAYGVSDGLVCVILQRKRWTHL